MFSVGKLQLSAPPTFYAAACPSFMPRRDDAADMRPMLMTDIEALS